MSAHSKSYNTLTPHFHFHLSSAFHPPSSVHRGRRPLIAVIGCGYWGKNLVRNFHALGALRLVCNRGEAGRARALEIAPGVEVCGDFESVLARKEIDAVALATPAETHASMAIAALEAGKDVFVEKPLALTCADGERMQQAAESTGRILMVGHVLEYHPAFLKLRELIEAGKLGKLQHIHSTRLNFGKIRTEEDALWSLAPHDIGIVLRLAGEAPGRVTCTGRDFVTPGVIDFAHMDLAFPGGLHAHIHVSWLHPTKERKLMVVGDKAMAVWDDTAESDALVLYDQRVEREGDNPSLHQGPATAVPFDGEEPLRAECRHFLECIANRQPPVTDGQHGLNVLKILADAS